MSNYINQFFFGIYPYIAITVFLLGSLLRYDRDQYTLKIINLTGHKLITGYPEGRRMWVNIKWYDNGDSLLREDGAYGPIGALVANPSGGPDIDVISILDLNAPNTKIYEAHYAITRDWAATIQSLHGPDFELSYDRMTGDVVCTVADFLLDDEAEGKKDACKGEHHDFFAGYGAYVVMQTDHLDARNIGNQSVHQRLCSFDQMAADIFDKVSAPVA